MTKFLHKFQNFSPQGDVQNLYRVWAGSRAFTGLKTIAEGEPMATPGLQVSSLAAADLAERHLLGRAQQGDEAAFAEIFERYKRRVYSLCLRLTRVPADAEDLTQDVFLLLFRKISTFRGESAFSTWLHRMVANVAFMHLRKKSRPQFSLDDP